MIELEAINFTIGSSVVGMREATNLDDDFIRLLYRSTREGEVAAFGWTEPEQAAFLDMQGDMQRRSYAMQYPGAEHMIVLLDEVAVGRFIVDQSTHPITLVDIAVLPDHRSRGIGRGLFEAVLRRSEIVVLSVEKRN